MIILGFALLGVVGSPHTVSEPSWIWWTPPHASVIDRLGRNSNQVLKMGWDRWNELCEQPEESRFLEQHALAFRVDGPATVWGSCLAERNDKLIAKLPNPLRTSDRELRTHLFRFGMACIGLESARDGGGTSSIHEPKAMWAREEEVLFEILTNQPRRRISAPEVKAMQLRLARLGSLRLSGEGAQVRIHQADIQKFSSLANAEFVKIGALLAPLRPAVQSDALAFEQVSISSIAS